jgi:hypothetical protein
MSASKIQLVFDIVPKAPLLQLTLAVVELKDSCSTFSTVIAMFETYDSTGY